MKKITIIIPSAICLLLAATSVSAQNNMSPVAKVDTVTIVPRPQLKTQPTTEAAPNPQLTPATTEVKAVEIKTVPLAGLQPKNIDRPKTATIPVTEKAVPSNSTTKKEN